MIRLVETQLEHKELLWNLYQKYCHELTKYYDNEMDETGNYPYRYFDAYFTEPERKALLFYDDSQLVGFTMINPYSFIGEKPDYVVAEFTIFPRYRNKHMASQVVESMFQQYPGKWELKYSQKNTAAEGLWNKVTAQYHPRTHLCEDDEVVLAFCTK